MNAPAVLCDFDGTIVEGDSMASFLRVEARRAPVRGLAVLAWALVAGLPWLLGGDRRRLLSVALWLLTVARGPRRALELCRAHARFVIAAAEHRPIPTIVERLRAHHAAGDEIWIVSGSCASWIAPVLRAHGVPYTGILGSRLGARAGGLVLAERCVGAGKPERIAGSRRARGRRWTHAYGNEPSDAAMLALAEHGWLVDRSGAAQPGS